MLTCFASHTHKKAIPIFLIPTKRFAQWITTQDEIRQNWVKAAQFSAETASVCLLPDKKGHLAAVLCGMGDEKNFWAVGNLAKTLPKGQYQLKLDLTPIDYADFALAWGLGAYQFTRYKKATQPAAQLVLPKQCAIDHVINMVESTYLVRDLVNTPADDLGPTELAEVAVKLSKQYKAKITQIIGPELLKNNYASIYTVGRASDDAPRLLDLRWGNKKHPKITLVGKGVCFDTGGLNIKPTAGMLLMKKDMGGAAHALGLARMIMQADLPLNLRVLIPVVENSIAGNAYRPGDIIKSRKGITIEIGNTDAEGRVILADALTEAVSEKPALLIDLSTLTGAARVAVGTDLAAMFTNQDQLAEDLLRCGNETSDPLWRLPLFTAYRDALHSSIADINNAGNDSYAGAITAALFLKEFVPDEVPWVHFDMMAWNLKARPGRPQGGEAMALRALFSYLVTRFVG